MNDLVSRYQWYLVAQLVFGALGALVLAVSDFGGFYYRAGSAAEVYGYLYLGSGVLTSVLILAGLAGLGYALWMAYDSLRDPEATLETLDENARRSIVAALFTAGLAVLGAIALAVRSWGVTWWLDAGFWGAFVGGVFVAALGILLRNEVEAERASAGA